MAVKKDDRVYFYIYIDGKRKRRFLRCAISMQVLIKQMQESGAITIEKVPEVILSKTVSYHLIDDIDLELIKN